MELRVRQVMTAAPLALPAGTTLADAAEVMEEHRVSDVLVFDYGSLQGIVTDREITVRSVAEGFDPCCTSLAEICRRPLLTVGPDDPVEAAADLMRRRGVSRLVVLDDGGAVGTVSLGDLARLEPESELARSGTAQ
jgi:CBS domain-containing protein